MSGCYWFNEAGVFVSFGKEVWLGGIDHRVAEIVKTVALQGDAHMEETGPVILPSEGELVDGP